MLSQRSATLGMLTVGIEVRDQNGEKCDQSTAFLHSLAFIGTLYLTPLAIIGLLVASDDVGMAFCGTGTTAGPSSRSGVTTRAVVNEINSLETVDRNALLKVVERYSGDNFGAGVSRLDVVR